MFITVIQVFKRFPLLSPLQFIFLPLGNLKSMMVVEERTRIAVEERIGKRGKLEHIDFVEFFLPEDRPLPKDPRDFKHIGALAMQLGFASFGPISDWFYSTLYFLLEEPECYRLLVGEIRDAIKSYDEITPEALISLPYLQACLEESLRLLPSNNTGLPRFSPGTMVDGQYIPKGVSVFKSTCSSLHWLQQSAPRLESLPENCFSRQELLLISRNRSLCKPPFLPKAAAHAISTIRSNTAHSAGSHQTILFMTQSLPRMTSKAYSRSASAQECAQVRKWLGLKGGCS
jgi:Cytochrome P450